MASNHKPIPIMAGQLWTCISERGKGALVRITRVTTQNVQFRPVGRRLYPGDDPSRTSSLLIAAFRVRYVLYADVESKQQELRTLARTTPTPTYNEALGLDDSDMGMDMDELPTPTTPQTEGGVAPRGGVPVPAKPSLAPTGTHHAPVHDAPVPVPVSVNAPASENFGGGEKKEDDSIVKAEDGGRPVKSDGMIDAPPEKQRGRNGGTIIPRTGVLSGTQAREIYLLTQEKPEGMSKTAYREEIARTYGIHRQTVYEIGVRRSYKWATDPLLEKLEREAKQEVVSVMEQRRSEQPVAPAFKRESPAPEPARVTVKPEALAMRQEDGQSVRDVAQELVEALETLAPYLGKPLPKFLSINEGDVRNLIQRARMTLEGR